MKANSKIVLILAGTLSIGLFVYSYLSPRCDGQYISHGMDRIFIVRCAR